MSIATLKTVLTNLMALCVACLCVAQTCIAAEKPELTTLFPPSGQVGSTVAVVATGKFPEWPTNVWSSHESIRWECQNEPGKLQAIISPDAPLGLHWIRIYNEAGSSGTKPFLIGLHPGSVEKEPNNFVSQANAIELIPSSVNGILSQRGDVDLFSLELGEDQTLAVSVESAKWLQTPADISLQILDAKGFVLAENMDHVGLDPYVEYRTNQRSKVIVKVFAFPAAPDSTIAFSGGADWMYRLTLASKPEPFSRALDFENQGLLEAERVEIPNAVHGAVETALPIQLPARVSGTISEPEQKQVVAFDAKLGSHYRVKTFAREFGSDLDATVAILNSQSQELTRVDDLADARDPVLNWVCPIVGRYSVGIFDFHRSGGPNHLHITTIEEMKPGFVLNAASELIESTINREIEVPIAIVREAGFAGSIAVSIDASPEMFQCAMVESKGGDETAGKVVLKLTGLKPFQGPIRIHGRAEGCSDANATAPRSKVIWLSISE